MKTYKLVTECGNEYSEQDVNEFMKDNPHFKSFDDALYALHVDWVANNADSLLEDITHADMTEVGE